MSETGRQEKKMFRTVVTVFDAVSRKQVVLRSTEHNTKAAAEKDARWARYCGANAEVTP
jgi:hypothetical protein